MRVTPACDTLNSFFIACHTDLQSMPSIVFGNANYYAVWADRRDTHCRIYGTRVTPGGQVLEPQGMLIGPADSIEQSWPVVGYNGSRYLAVWAQGAPATLMSRFIEQTGTPAETTRIAELEGTVNLMRILFDGTNFLLVWLEYCRLLALRGQFISSSGIPIGNPFVIAEPVDECSMGFCFDGANYVITWNNPQIWGRKYDRSGNAVGIPFRVSPSTNPQDRCAIVPGPNNRYLNVWCEYTGDSYDIYANLDIPIVEVPEHPRARVLAPPRRIIVNDVIELTGAMGKEACLYAATGSRVAVSRNGRLAIGHLPPGVYFVGLGPIRLKVVKAR